MFLEKCMQSQNLKNIFSPFNVFDQVSEHVATVDGVVHGFKLSDSSFVAGSLSVNAPAQVVTDPVNGPGLLQSLGRDVHAGLGGINSASDGGDGTALGVSGVTQAVGAVSDTGDSVSGFGFEAVEITTGLKIGFDKSI